MENPLIRENAAVRLAVDKSKNCVSFLHWLEPGKQITVLVPYRKQDSLPLSWTDGRTGLFTIASSLEPKHTKFFH